MVRLHMVHHCLQKAMNPPYTAAQIVAETGPLFLDFDGPVCAVFATLPAHTAAEALRHVLRTHRVTIPEDVEDTCDPLEVLRFSVTVGTSELTARVDERMRALELAAVSGAAPTPHAHGVIVAAYRAGRPVVIVSNNSADAIFRYLDHHRLTPYVRAVIGRPEADPTDMKPNPKPVRRAIHAVGADPRVCVLIGDSVTDIEAARAAGIRSVGYANKPGKRNTLVEAGADAIIEGPDGLSTLLRILAA